MGGLMRLRAILWIRSLPSYVVLLVGLVLTAAVGFLDYISGYELGFSLFYVVAIAFVTWFAGRTWGLLLAIISAGIWLSADIAAGNPYSNRLIPVWNTLIRFAFFLIITLLLAALQRAVRRTQELSRIDDLTGAVNSRFFYSLAAREIDRLGRYGRPLTAVYVDLDGFKSVNDTFGHPGGDEVLRAVADCAKKNLRKTDVVARLGGDEFAFLCPETDERAAQAVISKVQEVLLEEMRQGGWPVTFSIGVLTCYKPPDTTEQLVRMIDDLMYAVKLGTKNGVSYASFRGHAVEPVPPSSELLSRAGKI
jgi:diguanylate cyclase (GGDEF)-like protein